MKILFIGDVIGKPGRKAVDALVPSLRQQHGIDLVIANILLSLGMFQISPVTLSLPFKLLLFVLVDGWHLIAKGIILGYV